MAARKNINMDRRRAQVIQKEISKKNPDFQYTVITIILTITQPH